MSDKVKKIEGNRTDKELLFLHVSCMYFVYEFNDNTVISWNQAPQSPSVVEAPQSAVVVVVVVSSASHPTDLL